MSSFPRIASGSVLLYRLFDVADDIDLDRAEACLAAPPPGAETERLRLAGERSGFLDLPERPLTVALGERTVTIEGGTEVVASAHVRLFAHGVASVRYEVPVPAGADVPALAAIVHAAADSAALERAARGEAEALCARLMPALDAPHRSDVFETYAIVFVRALDGGATADAVAGPDLARILLGEPAEAQVSEQTVADVTRQRFSYAASDLCVLDWDTAFVLEPTGDRSVADVLEVACAQLLEFRYYDGLFEREMVRVTDVLGRPRAPFAWLLSRRYARLVRRVQNMVVETVEFVERVENAVRVVGDLCLARVYRAAVERFRVPAWQAGVRRRQETAAQVAQLLRSESSTGLGHMLEASILALILLEIVLALWR